MEPRALFIDDDTELAAMLDGFLGSNGFVLTTCHRLKDAEAQLSAERPDVVILDVMFPDGSGIDLLERIRARGNLTPVLLLTGRGEPRDRIAGLEAGADDYLVKPFDPHELLARLRALLRRASSTVAEDLVFADIALSSLSRSARVAGEPISLTGTEYLLLQAFIRKSGTVLGREQLSRHALGREPGLYDRSIDTHISNLRRKLVSSRTQISAVRGKGYVMTGAEPRA